MGIFRQANYKLKNQDYIKQLVHASSQCDDVPLSCKLQAARSIAALLGKTWEAVAPGKPQRCQSDSRTAERTTNHERRDSTRRERDSTDTRGEESTRNIKWIGREKSIATAQVALLSRDSPAPPRRSAPHRARPSTLQCLHSRRVPADCA